MKKSIETTKIRIEYDASVKPTKASPSILLLLSLTVRLLASIVTEMNTQSLAHCTLISKENALKNLMVMSATGQL